MGKKLGGFSLPLPPFVEGSNPTEKNACVPIHIKMHSKSGRTSLVSVFCNVYQTILQGRTCEQITCVKIYGKMFILFF